MFTLQNHVALAQEVFLEIKAPIVLHGKWLTEPDGSTMIDPQTSGLIAVGESLWTVSDASAHPSQIQRLHKIDKNTGEVIERLGPIVLSENVKKSCFADYLINQPDYEGIVAHPFEQDAWILVTEDATRGKPLSEECQQSFKSTGSTTYPTLLVEILLRDKTLFVSGVRALQFSSEYAVGNFPNDGIEGLAVGRNNRLYLGLEKDTNTQPRVFYLDLQPDTFHHIDSFIRVTDAKLRLPRFTEGNHPINGMDIYFPNDESQGYLIAAARNDNQLWLIDLSGEQSTKIIPLSFMAPSFDESCLSFYQMDNASLEGVAVDKNAVYLINDPWKRNYLKNAKCKGDIPHYERMSPLLFRANISPDWFE